MCKLIKFSLILFALAFIPALSHAQCTDSSDTDNDGIIACEDNCPESYNPEQRDYDSDGVGNACCCGFYTVGHIPGNIDCSPDGRINLADITLYVDFMYINKNPVCCPANVDLNFDDKGGLGDITKLIDHVYISRAALDPCY